MSVLAPSFGEAGLEESKSVTAARDVFEDSPSWTEQRERLLAHIRQQYIVRAESVVTYLRRNSDLAWMLLGAMASLVEQFNGRLGVELELVQDPDAEDRREQIVAYVTGGESLEASRAALDRFDEQWLVEHLQALDGRVTFDLKF